MNEAARPATSADVTIVARLATEARQEKAEDRGGSMLLAREAAPEPHRPRIAALLGTDTAAVIVGTIDDVVVGYAIMQAENLSDGSVLGRIDELFVLSEARGVGVGEAIMELLDTTAREWGCRGLDAVALPGDRHTKNFFETFGLKARAILVHRDLR